MSCRDICLILKDPWSTSGHVAHTDLSNKRDLVPVPIAPCTCEIWYRFAIAPCTQDSVPIAYTVGRAVDPRSQISDLRRDDSDLRSQVDCTSRQSPAREARRSKIWSGKVNVMSCRDICLDVKKPNVMSCRDICLKKFNMRHRHLPRINEHLEKGQPGWLWGSLTGWP